MKTFALISCYILGLALISCGDKSEPSMGEEPAVELPRLLVSSTDVSERLGSANGSAVFQFTLSKASTQEITFDYNSQSLTANAGTDFENISGTMTFAPNETQKTLSVKVFQDDVNELTEKMGLRLSNPSNVTLFSEVVSLKIMDDDMATLDPEGSYITSAEIDGYASFWSDEFDSPDIDQGAFTFEIGTGCPAICGWGNNELESYTDSEANVFVRDGSLVIKATNNDGLYESARIITKDKKEFKFGRIDVRAKLPEGQGIWPAIWMLGANIDNVGWPACGEIDIMELVGHLPSITHGTAHWGPSGGGSTFLTGDKNIGNKFSESFHVFTILWDENIIEWYLDETKFHEITASDVTNTTYPFNSSFFMILNVAIGGNWPGNPDETTIFPQEMEIDYIRVFQE